MKFFLSCMSLLLTAAVIGPFFIVGPSGQPLMTLDDVMSTPQVLQAEVEVHRWQDENGVWQFSGEPPEHADAERMTLDPEANVTPMGREWNVQRLVDGGSTPTVSVGAPTGVLDAYTRGPELMQQAQAAADSLSERYSSMPQP